MIDHIDLVTRDVIIFLDKQGNNYMYILSKSILYLIPIFVQSSSNTFQWDEVVVGGNIWIQRGRKAIWTRKAEWCVVGVKGQ
jgi:hypothetical protein